MGIFDGLPAGRLTLEGLTDEQENQQSAALAALAISLGGTQLDGGPLPVLATGGAEARSLADWTADIAATLANGSALPITATGSTTARTAAARAADVFNVKDYGAVGNGVADDTAAIQAAIDAAEAAGGGSVILPAGQYVVSARLTITTSRVVIVGAGMGVTRLLVSASFFNSGSLLFDFYNATADAGRALALNAFMGDESVAVAPAATAGLAAGDWLLLRTKRDANIETDDAPTGSTYRGELVQLATVNAATGALELESALADYYLTADSSNLLKVNMLEGVGLHGLSIEGQATSAPGSLSNPAVMFHFTLNARSTNVEVKNMFGAAGQFYSSVGGLIDGWRVDTVLASATGATSHYGLMVMSASRDCVIRNSSIRKVRHSVTFGTRSNSPVGSLSTDGREGIQRNCLVQGNFSAGTTSSHFDTHTTAEGTAFIDNFALGNWTRGDVDPTLKVLNTPVVAVRGANTLVRGNVGQHLRGLGIILATPGSRGARIENNTLVDIVSRGVSSHATAAVSDGATSLVLKDAAGFPASGSVTLDAPVTVSYTAKSTTQPELTGVTGMPDALAGAAVIQGSVITYLVRTETAGATSIRIRNPELLSASGSVTVVGVTVAYTGLASNTLTGCTGVKAAAAGAPVHYRPTSGDGINISSDATNLPGVSITDNLIDGADRSGISMAGGQVGVRIERNTCINTARRFSVGTLTFSTADRLIIRDNTVEYQNGSRALNLTTGDFHLIEGNRFLSREGHAIATPTLTGAGAHTQVRRNQSLVDKMTAGVVGTTLQRLFTSSANPATDAAFWVAGSGTASDQNRSISILAGGETTPRQGIAYYARSGALSLQVLTVGGCTGISLNGGTALTPAVGQVLYLRVGDSIQFSGPGTADTTFTSLPSLRVAFEE